MGERMFKDSRFGLFLLAPLLCTVQISAAQDPAPTSARDGNIHLDVVVTPKSGPPVSGLQQQDFTVLDNKVPQAILSFQAVRGREAPIEVVLVLDDVNTGLANIAYERSEIDKFLRTDGGQLAHPMALAFLTDDGVKIQDEFSSDGNELSAGLDKSSLGLHSIRRSGGIYSAVERLQISLKALFELGTREAARPGRKIILWISPGWPVLSGPGVQEQLDAKQEQAIYDDVTKLSTLLREGQITLCSIDPLGSADFGGRAFRWEGFTRGISKPSQAEWGDLALQVISTQSGGLALTSGNDISAFIRQCLADTQAYYEISFAPPSDQRPDQYHQLEVQVAKPGLTARTRQGYYSQPKRDAELTAESEKPGKQGDDTLSLEPGAKTVTPRAFNEQVHYANAHPYVDLPLAQLVERIPELKTLQPAPDQEELPVILQKMGRSVDEFARDIGDLIAHEDVIQEKLNAKGGIQAKAGVQDSYLILHHGDRWGASAEYRMDEKGKRLGPIGLEKGYLVTSGFALGCISFSTVAQLQSRFRYLGEEKVGSRDAYVLGFVQKPGEATFLVTMMGTGGTVVDMLTQGILWVDKNGFQIIRMRSDLLEPNRETQLDQLTTEETFGEVKLQDVANPVWLPSDVRVYMEISKRKFRNEHHYTDYRRYRVSVKIGDTQNP
jgi:VWFA-related protein